MGSIVLHLLILLLLLPAVNRDMVRETVRGERQTSTGGGGGGGGGGYISLPAFSPPVSAATQAPPPSVNPPTVVPTHPVPLPAVPPADTTPVPPSAAAAVPPAAGAGTDSGTGAGHGGGNGGGNGTGQGPGNGSGTGPGNGGGEGGRGTGPTWRQAILAPDDRPKELRGQTLKITFWIDSTGRPQRVQVEPEIKDKGFARKLDERLRAYLFNPARGPDGLPVAGTVTMSMDL